MPTIGQGDQALHYEVEGSGPDLVLHTGAGGDLGMWRQAGYVDGLRGRRLLLIDHRGHGASGRPRGVENHGLDSYVDDVLRVADDLGVDRFSMFGYSDGAALGYRLAARHPDRVRALVGLGAVGRRGARLADRVERASRIRVEGPDAVVRSLREVEPSLPDWFAEQIRSTDREMFALELEGWASWAGPWAEFTIIRAPTLVIVGEIEEDARGTSAVDARAAASALLDGRSVVLPGVGHGLAFVRSDLVLPHVGAFLDEFAFRP